MNNNNKSQSFKEEINNCLCLIENEVSGYKDISAIRLKEIYKLITAIIGIAKINSNKLIEELMLGILNVLDGISGGRYLFTKEHVKLILITNEYIKEILEKSQKAKQEFSIEKILDAFEKTASELPVDIDEVFSKDIIRSKIQKINKTDEAVISSSNEVKFSVKTIDNIISSVNELILSQYQLKRKIERINEFYNIFDELIDDSNSLDRSSIEKGKRKFKEVENEIKNQILKFERSAFDLQENTLALRMLPFSILIDEIKKQAYVFSEKYNKKFDLILPENKILMDKIILQSILQPIINIIKNAVEHGIENKNGIITIKTYYDSGKVNIEIEDNGTGINYRLLKEKCLSMFPHEKDKINQLRDDNLIKYLFLDGITTIISRNDKGFGLSEANTGVKQVKGKIILINKKGKGTTVKITVPKSMTTIYGYYIISGRKKFFFPSDYISEILIIDRTNILDFVTKQAIKLRDSIVPIYPLAGILDEHDHVHSEKLFIMIIEIFEETIGIVVDEILYRASAIYKFLPDNIKKTPFLQGIVLDEDFKIVNILYVPQIINKLKSISNIDFKEKYADSKIKYKKILVIDDSSVNLDIVKNLLLRNKFEVDVSYDGIDALQKIREKYYHLVITDTDMPRMDGLTFIENFRKEKGYEKSPVIVLASIKNENEINTYRNAGASSVYSKSNFKRDVLLDDICSLLGLQKNA